MGKPFQIAGAWRKNYVVRLRRVTATRPVAMVPRRTILPGSGTAPVVGGVLVPTGPVFPVDADRISTAKYTLGLPPDESCWKLAAVKPVPVSTTVFKPTWALAPPLLPKQQFSEYSKSPKPSKWRLPADGLSKLQPGNVELVRVRLLTFGFRLNPIVEPG